MSTHKGTLNLRPEFPSALAMEVPYMLTAQPPYAKTAADVGWEESGRMSLLTRCSSHLEDGTGVLDEVRIPLTKAQAEELISILQQGLAYSFPEGGEQ